MSIRNIAKLTGLSTATVSHAINGTREVSQKNRELISRAIQSTGYKPNMAAKALRQQRSQTVAMLIPTVEPGMSTNTFYMEVLSGAQDALEREGYHLLVATYLDNVPARDEAEAQIKPLQVLQSQWIDGVIFVPNKSSYERMLDSIGDTLPFVLVDRNIPERGCSCVHSDHACAAYEATALLFRNGKHRVGFIGGPEGSFTGSERYRGYRTALEAANLPLDESLVRMTRPYTMQMGYEHARQVIEAGADALFVANHVFALGALRYLQEANLRVPEQVALVTYEDYEWMDVLQPPLTSIRQQPYQMGCLAVGILLKKLKDPTYVEEIVLPTELVLRRSHGDQP